MITDQDIEDALDEVSDDELGCSLMDSNEICYLADAIVRIVQWDSKDTCTLSELDAKIAELHPYVMGCIRIVRDEQQSIAGKKAQEKDDAVRFSAPMADSFDDYQWRTA
jgi:hypothetical protein